VTVGRSTWKTAQVTCDLDGCGPQACLLGSAQVRRAGWALAIVMHGAIALLMGFTTFAMTIAGLWAIGCAGTAWFGNRRAAATRQPVSRRDDRVQRWMSSISGD
jgi:hypothetical protein